MENLRVPAASGARWLAGAWGAATIAALGFAAPASAAGHGRHHARRFVRATARADRGSIRVTIRLAGAPDLRFRVTLNGRPVTDRFPARRDRRRFAVLGAADGVRHGRNVVRVLARDEQGRGGRASAAARIGTAQPLLALGPDLHGVLRERMSLRGRLAAAVGRGRRVHYRWRVIAAPPGAHPRLRHSRRARAVFRPDRAGIYRLRLTASVGDRTAVGEVRALATPSAMPLGASFSTMADNGQAIQIGSATYPFQAQQGSGCNALNVVVVDRQTRAVPYAETLSGSAASATRLTQSIAAMIASGQLDAHPLVIVSDTQNSPDGPNCQSVDPSWAQVVTQIGGQTLAPIASGTGGWSIVGTWGTPAGTAWQNDGSNEQGQILAGALDGYLQYDGVSSWSFVPTQRLAADLDAPMAPAGQNQITLGPGSYPSGPLLAQGTTNACGTGGFQVVAVDAVTLAEVSSNTYATNGCGALDAAAAAAMAAQANQLAGGGRKLLVAVQSIGTPYDGGADAGQWPALGQALTAVGATPAVFAADHASYSLLGGAGIAQLPLAESSQAVSGQPAHVTAILVRGRRWAYEPALSSSSGGFGLGLALLAYQTPQPFDPSPGQQHALQYLDTVLDIPAQTSATRCYAPAGGVPDVRYAYCDPSLVGDWGGWESQVQNAAYPSSAYFATHPTFTPADLTAVRNQLAPKVGYGEFEAVATLDGVIASLQTAVAGGSGSALAIAGQQSSTIAQAVAQANRKTNGFTAGIALDFVGNLLTLVGAGTVVDLGDATKNAINTLSAGTLIAEDVTNTVTGAPALGRFSVDVADFKEMLTSRYADTSVGLQHLLDLVATDPGKLRTFFAQSASYTYVPSTQIDDVSQLGAAQFSWESLLPAAYQLVHLQRGPANAAVTDARVYSCSYQANRFTFYYHPFSGAPPSSQLLNTSLYTLVANGATLPDGVEQVYPQTPAASLTDPLFEPFATANGVITQFGLYPPWFYRLAYGQTAIPTVGNCN